MAMGFICEGRPHLRHHGLFALKGMNIGFFSKPQEGVISYTIVFVASEFDWKETLGNLLLLIHTL